MNRAKMHSYLVKYEKMHKNAKREFQRLITSKRLASRAVNDLVKVLQKAMKENTDNAIKIMLEDIEWTKSMNG